MSDDATTFKPITVRLSLGDERGGIAQLTVILDATVAREARAIRELLAWINDHAERKVLPLP